MTLTEAALLGDEVAAWTLGVLFDEDQWINVPPSLRPKEGLIRRDNNAAAEWYRKLTRTSTSSALPLDPRRKQQALARLADYDASAQQQR